MSAAIVVSDLRKVFPPEKKGSVGFTAVKGISFTLADGEVLGLLGPNGAGKSTTIAMLLGILTPTSGSIQVFGKDFETHRSEILQEVTFASTYIKMPWRLTVMENLMVYATMYGLSRNTFLTRAEKFLKFFDVWDQRDKTMGGLSAGQVTRIMLAKAFIPHPRIALLDEPTASLDPDIAHQVRDFVREQQNEYGTSILYTSHNMEEVADLCDRVMFLKAGEIVATDHPSNLAKSIATCRLQLQITRGESELLVIAEKEKLVSEKQNEITSITIDETKIAALLTKLAQEKITYSQIAIEKPTLEDYFLHMSK